MAQPVSVSVRSLLTAGVSAAVLGAAVALPVSGMQPARAALPIELSSFRLSAAVTPIAAQIVPTASNPITNAYDYAEPWVAYGFELVDYALSWVPGLWWIAPGVDLAYFSIEPLVQAAVYSVSYLLFAQFDQIPLAINNGLEESVQNFIDYGTAWIGSLIPLPPIPPFPPLPGASVSSPAASSPTRLSAPVTETVTAETVTADSGAVTADSPAAVAETTAAGQEVAAAVAIEPVGSTRQASRATRGAPRTPSLPRPAATHSAPADVTAASDGAGAAASTGTSAKRNAARASRGAGRAG
ncbi:MAG: hypothetical protein O3A42_17150 [Actinobacteria bacterium]|nr:hypothetical protein [Actinomycetota bacterium]